MLHQTIPLYEGNLPFFYACYSTEDDALAFPVLCRMYNEGFRLWCAMAGGAQNTGYRAMQRLNSASCVVLFMSRAMLELIRRGDPEVLAILKSSRLRMLIMLDDCEVDSSMFSLSAPERVRCSLGGDSAFWLHIYSSDHLERCRGPWPDKKLSLREETMDELVESAIDEEYRALENIMLADAPSTDEPADEEDDDSFDDRFVGRFANQPGYIAPAPDEHSYIPLEKVKAAKSGQDLEFDEVIGLIDRAVTQQTEIVEAHSYAVPAPAPVEPAPEPVTWDAKWYSDDAPLPPPTQEELDAYDDAFPEPEVVVKADKVVTPLEKKAESAPTASAPNAAAPVMITLPENGVLPTAGSAAGGSVIYIPLTQIGADGSVTEPIGYLPVSTDAAAIVTTLPEDASEQVEPEAAPTAAPASDLPPEPQPLVFEALHDGLSEARQTSVSVVVRRQPAAGVRVTPIARRIVRSASQPVDNYRLSRRSGDTVPRTISSSIEFEKYVRDIALSAIAEEQPTAEDFIAANARKYSGKPLAAQVGVMPAMPAMNELSVFSVAKLAPQPEAVNEEPVINSVAEVTEAADEVAEAKPTARKSRHPHKKGLLAQLRSMLHADRNRASDEPADTDIADDEQELPIVSDAAPSDISAVAEPLLEDSTAEETVSEDALQSDAKKPLSEASRRFTERNTASAVQFVPKRTRR